ncbi:hypothetical protein [Gordonia soli]|uniref:Lipoprotein n=1 Tax=Gordonia soli NBRC 108243 TaxID=1223545 RepID=M0QKI2_9ACTN|nr:hypothetical protein [Gordonia soli]GAC67922.1 hypothetical protein GS4_11_01910 [Gordonia soli NBRC 108243]
MTSSTTSPFRGPATHPLRRAAGLLLACTSAIAVVAGCSTDSSVADGELTGLLALSPGQFTDGTLTGSWFKMVQPGGTADKGPFMPNGDSPVEGGSVTLLQPGSEGGLRLGGYQSEPKPGFREGNSLSGSIMKPTRFFGVEFGTSTNPVDPQTGHKVAAPTVSNSDGTLSGQLVSWAASWNNQEFNQGAPKAPAKVGAQVPGSAEAKRAWDWVRKEWLQQDDVVSGTGPAATGTLAEDGKSYTLSWTSSIVGGPFNGFTGVWHLEGDYRPEDTAPSDTAPVATTPVDPTPTSGTR